MMYVYVSIIAGVKHHFLTSRSPQTYTGSFDYAEELTEKEFKKRYGGIFECPGFNA